MKIKQIMGWIAAVLGVLTILGISIVNSTIIGLYLIIVAFMLIKK